MKTKKGKQDIYHFNIITDGVDELGTHSGLSQIFTVSVSLGFCRKLSQSVRVKACAVRISTGGTI